MKTKFIIVAVSTMILGISSCNSDQNSKVLDDQGVSYLESEDPEMQQAIQESRNTLSELISAYKSNDGTIKDFAIKVPFKTEDGNEHIWISNITIDNDRIYGVVNNDPVQTKEVAFGDTIEIDKNNISDWNYIKNNKLHGGYSIKLLRKRMSPEERDEFDKNIGWIIE